MKKTYVKKEAPLHVLPRDVQVFTFLEAYIKIHGFAPTLSDIAKEFHTVRQSIIRTVARLEKMGCIHREAYSHRGITLIKSPTTLN